MAIKAQPLILRDWQYGMLPSVSESLRPDNYPNLLLNCYTDEFEGNELGDIKGRLGYTIIDSQIVDGNDITGLYNYISADQSTDRLIAAVNNSADSSTQTYYLNSGTWTVIGTNPYAWAASSRIRFATFLGYVFAVDGTSAPRTWDGSTTTGWTTTNVSGAPKGSLVVNFKDRIHIIKDSSIFSSSIPDVTAKTISWDGEELPISPDDNDEITAVEKNSGILLVFKNRALYTWDGNITQTDPLFDVGAVSQEAVTTVRGQTFFFGETPGSAAIFQYGGGYPLEISRPIRKWIEAIATTDYDDIVAFKGEDHVYYSVGTLTVEDETFTNVVLRYCVSKGTWVVYATADRITAGAIRVESDGTRSIVIGDNDGQVHTWNSGNTDNGTSIESIIRTGELEFGSRYLRKTIKDFAVYSISPQGASIRVRIDGQSWKDLGSLKNGTHIIDGKTTKGYFFEYEIASMNTGTNPIVFDGFEFFDYDFERYAR